MTFNKDYFETVDFNRVAIEQYGIGATAFCQGDHMWGWKAKRNHAENASMNLSLAAKRKFGPKGFAFTVGIHKNDWRITDFSKIRNKFVPVIFVTSNKIYDQSFVAQSVESFKTYLMAVQEWIRQKVGKTFDVLEPMVFWTQMTKAQFDAFNIEMDSTGANRFNYHAALQTELKRLLGDVYDDAQNKYIVGVAGAQQNGSAATRQLAVFASEVFAKPYKALTSPVNDGRGSTMDNIYLVGHELLHSLGLSHPPDGTPDRDSRLMWTNRTIDAVLSEDEVSILRNHPFMA